MPLFIGVTAAWSYETWGEDPANPQGIIYADKLYTEVIYRCGAVPLLLPPPVDGPGHEALPGMVTAILDTVGGLVLSGGGGARRFKPEEMPALKEQQQRRYYFEALLIREAWRRGLPVLGICRGHQMIAEVLGGRIQRSPVSGHRQPPQAKTAHRIDLLPSSRLACLIGAEQWQVNSYHCQVVEAAPPHFRVCARSPEGWIEAMEATTGPFWFGLQFHPELLFEHDAKARRLFQGFMQAAAAV